MAVAGSWAAGAVTPSEYAGSLRWGTGYNRIHAARDERIPLLTKIPHGTTTDDDAVIPESLLGPELWGYAGEDDPELAGLIYGYATTEFPDWGEDSAGRGDRADGGAADGYAKFVDNYPSWGPAWPGPYEGWPLAGGPPGGAGVRADDSGGGAVQNLHMVDVFTPGVSGGWMSKMHGQVLDAEVSSPSQYERTTSMQQLRRARNNALAVARATDDPRTDIDTRLTGIKEKYFAKDREQGGGPGTPEMRPVAQDLPFRPWFFRKGAMPPLEQHTWNEVTYFEPRARTVPADAGAQVIGTEAPAAAADYGYTGGDFEGDYQYA